MSFLAGLAEGGLESLQRRKLQEETDAEREAARIAADRASTRGEEHDIHLKKMGFAQEKSKKGLIPR